MSDGGTMATGLPRYQRVDEQVQTGGDGTNDAPTRINGVNRAVGEDATKMVACDYIKHRLDKAGFAWTDCPVRISPEPPRYCVVMRTMGDEFERRYAEAFHDMSTSLQITPTTAYQTFLNVCNELFRGDGDELEVKWGRVVALHAFAGALAVQCVDKEMPQQVGQIAEWLAVYMRNQLSQWIESHGGWNGFVQFYEKSGDEKWSAFKKVMAGVGVACGAVGVATLARMLISRP